MSHKIAIVGMGPTAIFAARAAWDLGCKVEIFTDAAKPMPPGATWLHWIPENMVGDFKATQIYVLGKGTAKNYSLLQWGMELSSSFPSEPVWETGYNPTEVLEKLLPLECNVNLMGYQMSDTDVRDLAAGFDLVLQTFPRKQDIADQPPLVPFVAAASIGTHDPQKNYVVYNGTGKGLIVREAALFGSHYLEFPKNVGLDEITMQHDLSSYKTVQLRDIHPLAKPMQIDGKVKLIGRWAQWDRKFLSHDAYNLATKFIEELDHV